MKIVIAGGTGFIGRRLISRLAGMGHTIVVLTRRSSPAPTPIGKITRSVAWNGVSSGPWESEIDGADVLVNLAGANIGGGRWTTSRKKLLLDSRVESTRAIVDAIRRVASKPSVLLNASAVGYYGDVPDEECREERPPGTDFLARICIEWEQAANEAKEYGVRVVMPRSGVVLDAHEGALPRFLLQFRLFAGGHLGSGRQWFSWVHPDDEVSALVHAILTPALRGPFNLVAPGHVRAREFTKILGSVLRRPSWAPVPGFVLKLVLGEMAGPLVLSGQRAVSEKLTRSGFRFDHPDIREALSHVLRSG